jgi:hypothetical protein
MVNVWVCGWGGGGARGFGPNSFVIKIQPMPMDGYYKTNVISGVGHPRSDSIMLLVLCVVCYAMVGAPALYYRSFGTVLTLLRMSNISGRSYC